MPTATWIGEVAPAGHLAGVQVPEPFCLVIFGATGDLAARKLLPSLYGLWQGGLLPAECAVVGVGRRPKDDNAFRADVKTALAKPSKAGADKSAGFLERVFYQRADFTTAEGIEELGRRLAKVEAE